MFRNRKKRKDSLLNFVLSTLIVFAFAFLLVSATIFGISNIALKNKLPPGIKIYGRDLSLMDIDTLDGANLVDLVLTTNLAGSNEFRFRVYGEDKFLNIADIKFSVDVEKLKNFGKGNFIKTLFEFLNLFDKARLNELINSLLFVDINDLLPKLNLTTELSNAPYIDANGNIKNCGKDSYYVSPDEIYSINSQIKKFIASKGNITIYLGTNEFISNLYFYCKIYLNGISNLQQQLYFLDSKDQILASLDYNPQHDVWLMYNKELLDSLIRDSVQRIVKPFDPGDVRYDNGKVYVFRNFSKGVYLSSDLTVDVILAYLNSKNAYQFISLEEKYPEWYNNPNLKVYDFTKVLGFGETRISVFNQNNGVVVINPSMVSARIGLDEINGFVVEPGEEFSFFNALRPTFVNGGWVTKSHKPIDFGICNSSTTIFRAALESGLLITERWWHSINVPSYEWPYPLNLVDAAYQTHPKIDLKFINNTKFPIMLKVDRWQENGYEYKRVSVLTSSQQPERKVELLDWKKWDDFGYGRFKGSFLRKVYEAGELIAEDIFYSHYTAARF
ncbi:hypothetical protein D6810_01710 [Candidatus Dojkabacteria bacterium]|uniref:Peptidoglycan binding domain-containing protein n=1 Tax=Candidatus Dojkabacteria bacterium TaxID=2099670 RepID=A0A3M0YYH4_9BACT|nr:MAG: hypothetical protein D6810_01710 [Candidatus Dojkabacteria bacterium]